ncbi:MAG: arginine--tRNA ligase, partial [Salinivirgaceae bacterium]|nr:arginine--tRNA ligase [Salinivirgaceae bacterium]
MINIEQQLKQELHKALEEIFGQTIEEKQVQIQVTRPDFEGDYTLVVFPLVRIAKTKPELAGERIGEYLVENSMIFEKFNVIKGFLNLSLTHGFWLNTLKSIKNESSFGTQTIRPDAKKIMIEYSSP